MSKIATGFILITQKELLHCFEVLIGIALAIVFCIIYRKTLKRLGFKKSGWEFESANKTFSESRTSSDQQPAYNTVADVRANTINVLLKLCVWIFQLCLIISAFKISSLFFTCFEENSKQVQVHETVYSSLPFLKWLHSILEHFDVTGVLVGMIGILVGFLIFIVVEKKNDQKTEEVQEKLRTLDEVTRTIGKYLTEVRQHKNTYERLNEILDVIGHAKQKSNELYVLTYAPIYGQTIMANLNVISENFKNPLGDISQKDFIAQYIRPFKDKRDQIQNALLEYSKNGGADLKLCLLKHNWVTNNEPRFSQFVEGKILSKRSIVVLNENEHDPVRLKIPSIEKQDGKRGTFILVSNQSDIKDPKREFVERIVAADKSFLEILQEKGASTEYLDYIPFQFFISAPKEPAGDYYCIVIFTNYYDLGQNQGVVSFSSKNSELGIGLKSMFKGLIESQHVTDRNPTSIRKLLYIPKAPIIQIMLTEFSEPVSGLRSSDGLTSTADSEAKDQLKHILRDEEIYYIRDTRFIDSLSDPALFENEEEPIFSIGLFHNLLARDIFGKKDYRDDDRGGLLFRLQRNGNDDNNKKIEIGSRGKYFSLESLEDGNDYALFSKIKMKGKWFFLFGGITSAGTKQIRNCLTEKNSSQILEYTGGREFAAIFKIGKEDCRLVYIAALTKICQ